MRFLILILCTLMAGSSGLEAGPAEEPGGIGYLGVVFTQQTIDVTARESSTIAEVRAGLGDRVEEGQVLAVLVSEELDESLARAEAALRADRAAVDRSRAELEGTEQQLARREALSDAYSKEEIEALRAARTMAKADLDAALARVEEQEAVLHELQERKESLLVRAPFSGAVAAAYRDAGSEVQGGTPLFRLINDRDLWVRFAVPSEESAWLDRGQTVTVGMEDSDSLHSARILQVAPEVDSASGMIFVEAILVFEGETPPRARAGLVCRVHRAPETATTASN